MSLLNVIGGVFDFVVTNIKSLFFAPPPSSSTGIETEMFGAWFSIGIWAVIIYFFISLASKPFKQGGDEE